MRPQRLVHGTPQAGRPGVVLGARQLRGEDQTQAGEDVQGEAL